MVAAVLRWLPGLRWPPPGCGDHEAVATMKPWQPLLGCGDKQVSPAVELEVATARLWWPPPG